MENSYQEVVYNQSGFQVVLSNEGEETKRSPHRLRYPNPDGETVSCPVEDCSETTTSQTGLCGNHRSVSRKYMDHPVDWIAELVPPNSEPGDIDETVLTHLEVTEHLFDWVGDDEIDDEEARLAALDSFVLNRVEPEIPGEVPDATALQRLNEGEAVPDARPVDEIVQQARDAVGEIFETDAWEDTTVPVEETESETDAIPITVAAALYYVSMVCEEANRGDAWYIENGEWKHSLKVSRERAGAYMPLGFYLTLRYTDAPVSAAKQVVRPGW